MGDATMRKKIKKWNFNLLTGTIIGITGAIFLAVGLIFSIPAFTHNDQKVFTEGTITKIITEEEDGETSHTVYIEYFIDNTPYVSILNSYSSFFYEGKKLEIYYQKDNVYQIGYRKMDYILLIFPVTGFILLCITFGIIIRQQRKKRQIKSLKESGECIVATIKTVKENYHYSINGRHPSYIESFYQDPFDHQKYTFKSELIFDYPHHIEEILQKYNIQEVPVYWQRDDKKNYYVDITDIIERLNESTDHSKNSAELS